MFSDISGFVISTEFLGTIASLIASFVTTLLQALLGGLFT